MKTEEEEEEEEESFLYDSLFNWKEIFYRSVNLGGGSILCSVVTRQQQYEGSPCSEKAQHHNPIRHGRREPLVGGTGAAGNRRQEAAAAPARVQPRAGASVPVGRRRGGGGGTRLLPVRGGDGGDRRGEGPHGGNPPRRDEDRG